MLETFAGVSPISMNRMIRFSTDHCWKKRKLLSSSLVWEGGLARAP